MQKSNNVTCRVMMIIMDFSRCKKKAKKTLVTCLGLTKIIINQQDVFVRTCKKSWIYPFKNVWKQRKSLKKPSKTISQGSKRLFLVQIPPPVWRAWMNFESSRSSIKKYMIKGWWMIQWGNSHGSDFKKISWWMVDKRTGEVMGTEIDSTYWKDKF